MKNTIYISLILLLLTILVISTSMFIGGDGKPETNAKDFWKYISEDNTYTNWQHWPGLEGMYEGHSPHGAYLKLYLNDEAYKAVEDSADMPDGAILIKENYAKDKTTLKSITTMYRSKGYNADAGDWFWAKYGGDGSVKASGKVQSCIECHMKVQDQDWLYTRSKKK